MKRERQCERVTFNCRAMNRDRGRDIGRDKERDRERGVETERDIERERGREGGRQRETQRERQGGRGVSVSPITTQGCSITPPSSSPSAAQTGCGEQEVARSSSSRRQQRGLIQIRVGCEEGSALDCVR